MFKIGDVVKVIHPLSRVYLQTGVVVGEKKSFTGNEIFNVLIANKIYHYYAKDIELVIDPSKEHFGDVKYKIGDRVNENTFGAGTIVKTLNGEYMIKFDTENYQLAQSEYDKTNCYAWRTAEQLTPLIEEKHIKQNYDFCVGDNVYVLINEGKTKKYGKIIGKLPYYCYIKFDGQVEEEAYSYATVFHADEQPASDTFVSETVQPVQKESDCTSDNFITKGMPLNKICNDDVSDFVDKVCQIFDDLKETFKKKNQQYATTDPLANFRTGALMHVGLADYAAMYEEAKNYQRKHIAHIENNNINGNKVDESLMDIAVYAVIMKYMYDKQHE